MKTNYDQIISIRSLFSALKFPFLLLMLALTLVACRNDDDEDRPEADLFGLWQPYKMTQSAILTTGPYSVSKELSICEQKSRILFASEGSGNTKTYTEENGPCVLQDDSDFTYSYEATTNTITITDENGTSQSGPIKVLSSTDLVYEIVGTYDFAGQENVTVTTTITARKTKD